MSSTFEEQLELCYRENYKIFVNLACKRLANNRSVAEEVVQEAFLRALLYKGKWQEDKNMFSWIRRIIYNTAIDVSAQERRYGALEGDVREEVEAEVCFNRADIKSAINTYKGTDLQKSVLRMRFLEGVAPKDIPCFIDVTYGSVRVFCHNFVKGVNDKT